MEEIIDKIDAFLNSDLEQRNQYIGSWRSKGEFPKGIIPPLLDILAYYFKTGEPREFPGEIENYPKFSSYVKKFRQVLSVAQLDDVLFFCAQSVVVNRRKIYLAAILKRILVCELDHIKGQMEALVDKLCLYDPSYIVSSSALDHIYAFYRIGPFFTFEHFRMNCLPVLRSIELTDAQPGEVPAIVSELDRFSSTFQRATVFTPEIIMALRRIYALRWNRIKGTSLDYTRKQPDSDPDQRDLGKNFWIIVAQMLSGARLIPSGYYRFLMPTITSDKVLTTGEPLENYSLDNFILSEDGTKLICLDVSASYVNAQPEIAIFCNREVFCSPKPFTSTEIERIRYAHPRFFDACLKLNESIKRQDEQPPVRRATVDMVYDLLISSLPRPIEDSDLQLAYLRFYEKLKSLDAEELGRLYAQRIIWMGDDYSFSDVLGKIALGRCTAVWGDYLLKFVLDYRPEIDPGPRVREVARVAIMSEQSAKRKFREIDADILQRDGDLSLFRRQGQANQGQANIANADQIENQRALRM